MTDAVIRFGTDGWRGLIAEEFTFPNLRRAAQAAATALAAESTVFSNGVLVSYDRRFLSREFADCVARIFQHNGYEVFIATQPMPTPALSVSVTDRKAAWGFMITASHNPALYNGFKVKDHAGRSAPLEVTERIESSLSTHAVSDPVVKEPASPFDYLPAYERYLRKRLNISAIKKLKGLVVFDPMHGVAANIPERLLKGGKLRMTSLHTEVDPLFGGLHPEPIAPYLNALKKEVVGKKASVGIAFDGDADRLGVVDDRGRLLTPHQVFPLLVLYGIEHKKWTGKIVQAVSLGYLSERIAKAFQLPFEEVPVGFKYVAERMLKEDVLAGGEESGGYAFCGGLPERDGILNGLLFLEMIAATGKKPSKLLADLEKQFGTACFKRIDIILLSAIRDKAAFVKRISARVPNRLCGLSVKAIRDRDGLKIVRQDDSWVLLRPSGTEPLLRTYAESKSWKETEQLLKWAEGILADEIR